ncbi:MAG: hypothetical protein ACRDHP_00205 [Ktedonobacterales bacterium]
MLVVLVVLVAAGERDTPWRAWRLPALASGSGAAGAFPILPLGAWVRVAWVFDRRCWRMREEGQRSDALRCEKRAVTYLAMVTIAAIVM